MGYFLRFDYPHPYIPMTMLTIVMFMELTLLPLGPVDMRQ